MIKVQGLHKHYRNNHVLKDINLDMIPAKIRAMQTLGVPYPEGYDEKAVEDLMLQAEQIVNDLKNSNIDIEPTSQMVAMIAYMHKLGRDIAPPPTEVVKSLAETETGSEETQNK